MAGLVTNGYDIVAEITEQEINRQLICIADAGVLPQFVEFDFNTNGYIGRVTIEFGDPEINFDSSQANGVNIILPFNAGSLELNQPFSFSKSFLGQLEISDNIEVFRSGNNRRIRINFQDGVTINTTILDDPNDPGINGILNLVPNSKAEIDDLIKDFLQNDIQEIAFPDITVRQGNNPPVLWEVDVRTINDNSAADRDCLAILMTTDPASVGNPNAFTQCAVPAGEDAIIMLSNDMILRQLICPNLAQALNIPAILFGPPCRLLAPVPIAIEGQTATLEALELVIINNQIVITGRLSKSGTGWDATADFSARIQMQIVNNQFTVQLVGSPIVDVDVDMEWWVYALAGLSFGFLFGLIFGVAMVVVVAIIDQILDRVFDDIIANLLATQFNVSVSLEIPTGPCGNGLDIADLVLDDLTLIGTPFVNSSIPIKSQNQNILLYVDQGLDLDNGHTVGFASSIAAIGVDIIWQSGSVNRELVVRNGSKMAIINGQTFSGLTRRDLQMAFINASTNHSIPESWIPTSSSNQMSIAVRTSKGRFAKLAVWKVNTGLLHVQYITYDSPTPCVDIQENFEVQTSKQIKTGQKSVTEYEASHLPAKDFQGHSVSHSYQVASIKRVALFNVNELTHVGHFKAVPKQVVYPLDIQWCFNGHLLKGNGSVVTEGQKVFYEVNGKTCDLTSKPGGGLSGELCVSVIDARGLEVNACRHFDLQGTNTHTYTSASDILADKQTAITNVDLLNNNTGVQPSELSLPNATNPIAVETQFLNALKGN